MRTVRGHWTPVPVGARVLYFPSNIKDIRQKRDIFLGDCRLGLFAGYGVDLTLKRSFVMDEYDLMERGNYDLSQWSNCDS